MTDSLIHQHIQKQKKLLDLELRSEQQEHEKSFGLHSTANKQRKDENNGSLNVSSRILSNLEVDEWSIGLMGRTIVTFSKINCNSSGKSDAGFNQSNNKTPTLLPAHRLSVGDEVEILYKSKDDITRSNSIRRPKGVISAITNSTISIALSSGGYKQQQQKEEESTEENGILGSSGPPYTILPQSSVNVHQKLLKSLNTLEKFGESHHYAGSVVRAIFDTTSQASILPQPLQDNIVPFNSNLDSSQLDAIQFALSDASPIFLIHGPPGTGKTTTVAELIQQAVHVHKWRVLVTAPSNVAVDNILQRLINDQPPTKKRRISRRNNKNTEVRKLAKDKTVSVTTPPPIRAVRLGHPARIQPSILSFSLDALVNNSDGTEVVKDVKSELKVCLDILSNPNSGGMKKRAAYGEMKLLRKEIRQREEKVVEELLLDAQVVLSTNVGAGSSVLDKLERSSSYKPFDLVVIDEAAQALEASCWIPILRGKRLVLAGDHKQLPPTIKSSNAEVQRELRKTLFSRIMKRDEVKKISQNDDKIESIYALSRMLRIQYRMHEEISEWSSKAMYRGELQSHDSVKARKLCHLPHVRTDSEALDLKVLGSSIANSTLRLIDTAGCEMFESTNKAGSRFNEGEAELVAEHVRSLLKIGLKAEEIAVITPYNGQVELLRAMLLDDIPNIEIRSVDGFQGSEREAVVLSLVRSSAKGGKDGIGFLSDERRLNVAVTRAKRQCCIICDSETVKQNSFLKSLVDWFEEKGEYISAMELDDDLHDNQMVATSDDISQLSTLLKNVPIVSQISEQETVKKSESDIAPQDKRKSKVLKKCSTKSVSMEMNQVDYQQDERKSIHERLALFAEIAENGEELELKIPLTTDNCVVHNVCEDLCLLYMNEEKTDSGKKITVSVMDAVQQREGKRKRRSELMDRLGPFSSSAENGKEMELNDYSLKFDYCLIPEICEELRLVHKIDSSGDTDRHLLYTNRTNDLTITNDHIVDDITKKPPTDHCQTENKCGDVFHDTNNKAKHVSQDKEVNETNGSMNNLLGSLAKERAARNANVNPPKKIKGKTNKNGRKIGKSKKQREGKKVAGTDNSSTDDLDDMAFLESEIQKVQTSHGRTIEASGTNYRSIVNGILIAKPKPQEKKRDSRTSAVLKEKLKQSQNSRRAKKKK